METNIKEWIPVFTGMMDKDSAFSKN